MRTAQKSRAGKGNLQEAVIRLIERKLRYQSDELGKLWTDTVQCAYKRLSREISASVTPYGVGPALISASLKVYDEFAAYATKTTYEWPETLWKTIIGTLEAKNVAILDSSTLQAMVDKHCWGFNDEPFTLTYVNAERFMGVVHSYASRYGNARDKLDEFDRQLRFAASAVRCGTINRARHAREKLQIAIDEYVLTQRSKNESKLPPPSRREVRKHHTNATHKAWQQEYRRLKKKHPAKSDTWCANQIAKMDIAQGRNAETIRKCVKP